MTLLQSSVYNTIAIMDQRFDIRNMTSENTAESTRSPQQGGTLVRDVQILDLLMERGPCTLRELSERLSIHKSTVLRLVTTLRELGVVEHDEDRQRYRLGVRLMRHGHRIAYDHEILRVGLAYLERLRDTSGESTNLTVLNHGRLILLSNAARDRVGISWGSGMAHSTASGKAMLAHLSDEEVEHIYHTVGFPAQTDHTITDLEALRKDLRRTRERGYSLDHSENSVGFRCIGSPIFGPGGNVEAALSIEAPVSRFSEEVYLPLVPVLRDATFDISIAIGADHRRMSALTPPTVELPVKMSTRSG